MIYLTNESNLLATGLPLKVLSEILIKSKSDKEIQDSLKEVHPKYLKRYLIFSEYKTLVKDGLQKLPIIPIIAGIPGVGKTTLAKELSAALDIGIVIGGDALRSSLRSVIKRDENKIFHESVYNTWKYFGDFSKENLAKGFETQAKIMNKAVERMVFERGLRDGESMIVEYLHFLPKQFSADFLKHPSVIPILLQITNEDIYRERIKQRSKYSHIRSPGDRLLPQISKYFEIQEYFLTKCSQSNFKRINMNELSEGFEETLDYILLRIEELNKLKDITIKNGVLE